MRHRPVRSIAAHGTARSPAVAVIDVLLRKSGAALTSNASQWARPPLKCPFPWRDLHFRPNLIRVSLDPPESALHR